jgi:hypothetical protein
MKSFKPITVLLTSLIAALSSFQILAVETLDSHEHGSANLNIAIDNKVIAIHFESPAVNIIGFEYQPNDEAQRSLISAAKSKLSNFANSYELQGEPNCLMISSSADWVSEHSESEHSESEHSESEHSESEHSESEHSESEHSESEHSEHSESEHSESEHSESEHSEHSEQDETVGASLETEHAEFVVEFELQCEQINNLTAIDVSLLALFPAIDEIDTQVIYTGGQIKQELTRNNTLIKLMK